jgi:hypothetical protein
MITRTQAPRPAAPEPLRVPSAALSLALFLFLFSVYLLTYTPRINSSDGLAMFATAESLARRGEWDADQIRWMGLQQGIFGPDGHLYIRKGVGVSLLALPLAGLGLIVPIWGMATATLLFNALVTAATGALLLGYLQALGYSTRVALVAALTFGLATLAWPYAKSLFSDPLAGLCLLAAALALLRYRQTGRASFAFWAGLALAVAVAARYANAAVIPLFGLLLIKYQISNGKSPVPKGHDVSHLNSLISHLRGWIAFGAPLAAAALGIALYNLARYGDPLNTGYLPEENFGGVWWQGLVGLLVSPGRGLFLYAPVVLLALPAAPAFFRRQRAEAVLSWAIILAHLLLYGKWFMWHGGYAWGPRFIVPTLPFFVVAMAPAVEWARQRSGRWGGFLALAVFSGLIQVLGLSVHFELFQTRLLDTGLPLFAPITFFAPRYSPLVGQFQFLRPENLDLAWITNGRVDWLLLAGLLAAVCISAWGLWKTGRMEDWKHGRSEGWKDGRPDRIQASSKALLWGNLPIYQSSNLPIFQSTILPALIVALAAAWLLARAHALYPDDLREAVAVLNTRATAADAVITGTPEEAAAFADLYKGHADVLGLDPGAPLDADTTTALVKLTQAHPRVWWLPNWQPPGESRIERWLMSFGFRAEDRSLGARRLAVYYFPPQPLAGTTINTVFGNAIVLDRASTLPTVQPGDVLPVTLHWQARQPIPADYQVFVHLLDAEGNLVAQADGQPALWARPTSSWRPEEPIEDRHALWLPADLPPGDYTLLAGLYLPASGERLSTDAGGTTAVLGSFRIRSW